ncbi:MAG: NAD(P)/FAD-dependent oxidoreductase [Gammaproteobacteria bacterium]|nr:NAD(P)/FAD-dependent oxidoreductase [Gammaproteobacteria bacterium]
MFMANKEKLVVVGNGMAGMRTVEELLQIAPDKFDITVFGSEPYGNYNRILLSPVLAGEKTINDIMLNDVQWYTDNHITLHTGETVTEIDRKNCIVKTDKGTSARYDRLLIATGSNPFIIPIPGHDLPGVITFRDIHDVDLMLEAAQTKKHAVVIGGGLLGLEAANGLMKQGMSVTVVHLMDWLMERQMDEVSGAMLKKSLSEKGMQFMLRASTKEVVGKGKVEGVKFADGTTLAADIVVMAVGIRPNIDLAKKIGLHCERGIVVNDTMQTYDPKIYSVGECVQHRGQTYGLVAPLFEMAKVCANHLAAYGIGMYRGSVTSTKLKVTGIDLFSAGNFTGDEHSEDIVVRDAGRGIYKKVVLKDGRIIGSVLYGDTVDGAWYFQLMREQTNVTDIRDKLMFGQAHLGDSGHGGNVVANMSDATEICGCNGVCKGTIVNAITSKGLFTLEDVRLHTKASSSCGSCTGLVEQILETVLGGDYSAPEAKPMCGCTEHTHEVVREAIRKQKLTSIPAVMSALKWKNADGCSSCRPALNYYLLSTWPKEVSDDPQSRFINERAHANIQKDGTYSVIPRMWGGMTTPNELRAIADVADEYKLETVHVTGGQRIGLYGIKKQELPDVWKKLNDRGLVSGHAYGKALRTVKTCVGKEWCRFGTQDSTAIGIKLEQLTWGSWMPHKFKMAASGCPRNCAEATIKDFGVVCVDSGYELHVGGNGGIKVRATDLLCKVETEAEVLEYAAAFIQLYREEARYLDRTAPWIERVGLSYVKENVVDNAEKRKQLAERFKISQQENETQDDPWLMRSTEGRDQDQFKPLKVIA